MLDTKVIRKMWFKLFFFPSPSLSLNSYLNFCGFTPKPDRHNTLHPVGAWIVQTWIPVKARLAWLALHKLDFLAGRSKKRSVVSSKKNLVSCLLSTAYKSSLSIEGAHSAALIIRIIKIPLFAHIPLSTEYTCMRTTSLLFSYVPHNYTLLVVKKNVQGLIFFLNEWTDIFYPSQREGNIYIFFLHFPPYLTVVLCVCASPLYIISALQTKVKQCGGAIYSYRSLLLP